MRRRVDIRRQKISPRMGPVGYGNASPRTNDGLTITLTAVNTSVIARARIKMLYDFFNNCLSKMNITMVNEFPKMANTQMQMYKITVMEAIPPADFRNARVAYLKKVELQFHLKNWQSRVLLYFGNT